MHPIPPKAKRHRWKLDQTEVSTESSHVLTPGRIRGRPKETWIRSAKALGWCGGQIMKLTASIGLTRFNNLPSRTKLHTACEQGSL